MALEDLGTGLGALFGEVTRGLGEGYRDRKKKQRGIQALQQIGYSPEESQALMDLDPHERALFLSSREKGKATEQAARIKAGIAEEQQMKQAETERFNRQKYVDKMHELNDLKEHAGSRLFNNEVAREYESARQALIESYGPKSKAQRDALQAKFPAWNQGQNVIKNVLDSEFPQNQNIHAQYEQQAPLNKTPQFIEEVQNALDPNQLDPNVPLAQQTEQAQQSEQVAEEMAQQEPSDAERVGRGIASNLAEGIMSLPVAFEGLINQVGKASRRSEQLTNPDYYLPERLQNASPEEKQQFFDQVNEELDKRPFEYAQDIKDYISESIAPDREPRSDAERIAYRAANILGSAIPFGAASSPTRLATDVGAAATAGLLGEYGKQFGPAGEFAGEFTGSILGSLATSAALSGIKNLSGKNVSQAVSRADREAIKFAEGKGASPETLRNWQQKFYNKMEELGEDITVSRAELRRRMETISEDARDILSGTLTSEKGQKLSKEITAMSQRLANQRAEIPIDEVHKIAKRFGALARDSKGSVKNAYQQLAEGTKSLMRDAAKDNPEYLDYFKKADWLTSAIHSPKEAMSQLKAGIAQVPQELWNQIQEKAPKEAAKGSRYGYLARRLAITGFATKVLSLNPFTGMALFAAYELGGPRAIDYLRSASGQKAMVDALRASTIGDVSKAARQMNKFKDK